MFIQKIKFLRYCRSVFVLSLVLLATACQNLRPSQHPMVRLNNVHHFGATRIAFSPSGNFLASGGFQGEVKIWTVPGGKLVKILKKHTRPVRGLVWINDDTLVSAAQDGRLLKWNIETSGITRAKRLKSITSMTWSAKLQTIITGHKNGNIRLFKAQDLSVIKSYSLGKKILSVSASSDGLRFAASTSDRRVLLFDHNLLLLKQLKGPRKKIYELRFSPDNTILAGSSWFRILLWNIETGQLAQNKTEHLGAIVSLDFHPDGKRIVSIGRHTDATLRLSNVNNGKTLRRLEAHEYCGWNIRFSPNGRYVASSSEDEGVRIYDLAEPYKPTIIPLKKK